LKRFFAIAGLLLMTLPLVTVDAQEPTKELLPFASLVGKAWVGEFPGGNMTDEQTFEWIFGGKFLRSVHKVVNTDGATVYEGETIFAWHPNGKTIVWWYFNATGGFITGTITQADDGWVFEGINHSPPPQPQKVRGVWRIKSDSEWESVQYFLSETDEWRETFTMTFRPKE
jgi:hypothetical protein